MHTLLVDQNFYISIHAWTCTTQYKLCSMVTFDHYRDTMAGSYINLLYIYDNVSVTLVSFLVHPNYTSSAVGKFDAYISSDLSKFSLQIFSIACIANAGCLRDYLSIFSHQTSEFSQSINISLLLYSKCI